MAPSLPLSWISLLIGAAVVSVSLSDPVIRLSEHVRANGPIIVAADDAAGLSLAGVLPEPRFLRGAVAAPAAAPDQPAPPVVAEAAPPMPDHDAHVWDHAIATAPAREAALALDRAARIAVQRRLALTGYDPQGVDGALGPRSREAIARWQRDFGFPETGYVDAVQLASLEERSALAWGEWQAERARAARRAVAAVEAPEPSAPSEARSDCVRGDDGRILGSQSFGCDLKGVKEGFQRLFSKVEDDEGIPASAITPAGADR